MINGWRLAAFACAILGAGAGAAAAPLDNIMAWGDKPTDSSAPFVTQLRMGCQLEPAACLKRFQFGGHVRSASIAFAKADDAEANLAKAAAYSQLSKTDPTLQAIGIDDLMAFIRKLEVDRKDQYLIKLIDAAKSANADLKVDVTIYEDELDNIARDQANLPPALRNKIDRVALYLHFRNNAANLPRYVAKAKSLFPHALIYGGVYHYDRSDYVRCNQQGPGKCTSEEEIGLYADALKNELELLRDKKLDGLEFYPGFLGQEASWPAWSKARICDANRRAQCVEVSEEMTTETLRQLRGFSH